MNMYKLFIENLPCPAWIEDVEDGIIVLNNSYEKLFNVNIKEAFGRKNIELLPKNIVSKYKQNLDKCLSLSSSMIYEDLIDGSFVDIYIFPLMDNKNQLKYTAGVIIDVNDRKEREIELSNQKNILNTIIDSLPEAVFYKDKESKFIGYNRAFSNFYTKRGINEILGKTDLDIYSDKELASIFINQDKEVMISKKIQYREYSVIDGDDITFQENVKVPVIGDDGQVWGVVGLSRDITSRKLVEERLRHLSYTDILTGLYNRSFFEEKIKKFDKEEYMPLGIIMGDVNGLKLVNDTLGHLEGDSLLKGIAKVLKTVCSSKGEVFRWGGDEFMVLLPNHNETNCEKIINSIIKECKNYEHEYIQLNIALGESVKNSVKQDIYTCIKEVEEKVYRHKLLEKKSIRSTIMDSLKKSLEEKNMETEEHTERVLSYALEIGKSMGLNRAELDELTLVARLHDIGKIGISEDILLKPDELTKEEFEIMKTHTEKGYRIIHASSELINIAQCVLTHHEQWDGNGYPLKLKGEEIPLMARIIAVVDAYDVMTHDRIYKKAMTKEDAIDEMIRCSGTQFDPKIVDLFVKYLKNEKSDCNS